MLGIGDRHVSNILMDNGTGEVVHIDFGVAFEQVSALPQHPAAQ
jgi:ataxia telangiectasia mutated family protein